METCQRDAKLFFARINDIERNDLQKQVQYLKTLLANGYIDTEGDFNRIMGTIDDFSTNDKIMSFNDLLKPNEDDDIEYNEENGRISLAYERLPVIPKKIAEKFATKTHTLDLCFNDIKDLSFLSNFKNLHTLILDSNTQLNEKTLPVLTNLRILWLNKCNITNLSTWINRIKICTPNIRHLSLMGNPGVRSTLNGCSLLENNDYIMYVVGNLPTLEYLDDIHITDSQRTIARTHIGCYSMGGAPIKFMERFSDATDLLNYVKFDEKMKNRSRKSHPSTSKFGSKASKRL